MDRSKLPYSRASENPILIVCLQFVVIAFVQLYYIRRVALCGCHKNCSSFFTLRPISVASRTLYGSSWLLKVGMLVLVSLSPDLTDEHGRLIKY